MATCGRSWLVAVALAGIWPAIAAAKAERLAFVSSEADGKVVVVDLDETALGHHGAFPRDRRHFLFCNEGGHHVSVLDVGKRTWVKTIETGQGPGHAALSPDGRFFFVVHHHDRVVTVIEAVKLEAVKNITIADKGEQSHAAWFTPDGRFFYVVSGDGALVKIDVARGEVASGMGVGPRSFFFVVKDGEGFSLTE